MDKFYICTISYSVYYYTFPSAPTHSTCRCNNILIYNKELIAYGTNDMICYVSMPI